jgi:CBS domain-containing protein
VAQVMRRTPKILAAQARVEEAVEETRASSFRIWPVAEKDYFLGMVSRETLECALVDGRKELPLKAIVDTRHVQHVHLDHALHLALERMSAYHLDVLPVIHRADIHKLLGVVTLHDVLDSYGVIGAEDWSGS